MLTNTSFIGWKVAYMNILDKKASEMFNTWFFVQYDKGFCDSVFMVRMSSSRSPKGRFIVVLFHHFFPLKVVKYSWNFKLNSRSKYNPLSLTFLCINRQTRVYQAPVGSRGNYLEKAAMLQVEGGMLITFVDSQDDASLFSFAQPLYRLINYETMHRWFIWEQEIFKPFFFFSHLHNNKGKVVPLMS